MSDKVKDLEESEDGEESRPSFMGIDFGRIFEKVFGGNPFDGMTEIFKGMEPGSEVTVDEVQNSFDFDWDDTIKAAAHGSMSRVGILVQTKGKASGKSWFKGGFKRLFPPKEEKKEDKK